MICLMMQFIPTKNLSLRTKENFSSRILWDEERFPIITATSTKETSQDGSKKERELTIGKMVESSKVTTRMTKGMAPDTTSKTEP